jgi:hypothetical protein
LGGVACRLDGTGSRLPPRHIAACEELDLENEEKAKLFQLFCATVLGQAPMQPIRADEMSLPSLTKCARECELFSMLVLLKVRQQSS